MKAFGWSLPPGVTQSMIDPPDRPCEVCGQMSDDCICPECPKCKAYGDPRCYKYGKAGHGLKENKGQLIGAAEFRMKELQQQIHDEAAYLEWLHKQNEPIDPDNFWGQF